MKTVTVRVVGGLGNQLHCYAFGRAMTAGSGAVLKLDCEAGYRNDPFEREFLLDMFPGTAGHYVPYKSALNNKKKLFALSMKVGLSVSRLLPMSMKLVIAEEPPLRYKEEIMKAEFLANPYFIGYWASPCYYVGIEDELRTELAPQMPDIQAVREMRSQIAATKSCFIHWRSYNEDKGSPAGDMREYYNSAISLVQHKLGDVSFFVFSDDIQSAKEQIKSRGHRLTFVDLAEAKGNMQSLADFYLMYKCDHAIIGNSTFSWWAAWLAEQNDKVVVAPDGLSPWGNDWTPSDWILIGNNGERKVNA